MHPLRCTFAFCTVIVLGIQAHGQDWPNYIVSERLAAEALVEQGELTQGASRVMASLRAIPQNDPALADAAWASVQLLVYTMEYLMDDATLQAFHTGELNLHNTPIDRVVASIYNIYIGQETVGKEESARRLVYQAAEEYVLPKIFALFVLSDPYYFRNPDFASQNAELLAGQYPELELSQTALNLAIYDVRNDDDPQVLSKAVERDQARGAKARGGVQPTRADWSTRYLQQAQQAAALMSNATTRTQGVQQLLTAAKTDVAWQGRFASLLTVERYRSRGYETDVEQMCKVIANRQQNTPDVVRARVILGTITTNRLKADPANRLAKAGAIKWAEELLITPLTVFTPERNLYEERMKGIRHIARVLAETGHEEEARKLFNSLSQKYPNSLVSAESDLAAVALDSEQ